MHYTVFVGLAYQECLLCDTWLSSVIRCVGRELSKVVLYMTPQDAQWWCHGQSVPIATSVICAGHTSLFKSGFRLVTSVGGNYILCCTIQDTSRDINSLYYMGIRYCSKADWLQQKVWWLCTALYNRRYFKRHKQLVLYVQIIYAHMPVFESGFVTSRCVKYSAVQYKILQET